MYLLDINVLIALFWSSSIHHDRAHKWFSKNSKKGWATCPITQLGFVRISSNPKIISPAVSPNEAIDALSKIVSHKNHSFWEDDIILSTKKKIPTDLLLGHRQITDAYLLGLALKNRGKLVTFDKGIASLCKPESSYRKALILL